MGEYWRITVGISVYLMEYDRNSPIDSYYPPLVIYILFGDPFWFSTDSPFLIAIERRPIYLRYHPNWPLSVVTTIPTESEFRLYLIYVLLLISYYLSSYTYNRFVPLTIPVVTTIPTETLILTTQQRSQGRMIGLRLEHCAHSAMLVGERASSTPNLWCYPIDQ